MRIVYADPDVSAAPSIASTGVKTRPGLIDVERAQWLAHQDRRAEVLAAYLAYDDVYQRAGPADPATDAARRDATASRLRLLPRHLWRSRFRETTKVGDAVELRALVEDPFARADARRRGIALPGTVTAAAAPIPGNAVLRSGKWERTYTFEFTVQITGSRPLGRFREGRDVSFGAINIDSIAGVIAEGVVTSVDHAARTVSVAYTWKATSSRGEQAIREPRARISVGQALELLPSVRFAGLGDDFMPTGPRPSTHERPAGGGSVVLAAAAIPARPIPQDLQ